MPNFSLGVEGEVKEDVEGKLSSQKYKGALLAYHITTSTNEDLEIETAC